MIRDCEHGGESVSSASSLLALEVIHGSYRSCFGTSSTCFTVIGSRMRHNLHDIGQVFGLRT